ILAAFDSWMAQIQMTQAPTPPLPYPRYGFAGIALMVAMGTAVVCSHSPLGSSLPWWPITMWTTPVMWWGYIVAVDAWIYARKGSSPLTTRRRIFALECILSIAFWCLFEAYNQLMPGWRYLNLTEHLPTRFLGYAIAFATIMPGMFHTCELLQTFGL